MIDTDGFKKYLSRIGLGFSSVDNMERYARSTISILEKIDGYKNLNNNERLIKFSKEIKNFSTTFNRYHNYKSKNTFSDYQNSAKRYANYLKSLDDKTKEIYNKDTNTQDEELFYGLWLPVNKPEVVDDCIKNGIWANMTATDNKDKLKTLKKNDKVFLYYQVNYTKIIDSPFAKLLSKNYPYFYRDISYNTSPAIGVILSIDIETETLKIEWDKNYKQTFWYLYMKRTGLWKIYKKDYGDFYDIIYNHKEQDYQIHIDNKYFKNFPNSSKCKNIKNIILYGAPGVGKTHNYKRLVSMIEGGKNQKDIFETISKNKDTLEFNNEIFNMIRNKEKIKFITFHQSYSYEDFIEGFRPQEDGSIKLEDGIFKSISNEAKNNKDDNYYIVIDEINRGNISKIFGELITLIEEDKRDEYEVTLPYSKETFSIPSNLYIIATMNSSDKSIATIDIALRRRFTFINMLPNLDLVKYNKARELMEKLNVYIKDNLGEDYMLGHSYFMKIEDKEDLEFVKEHKVEPLLKEYFYADDDKLKDILEILNSE